MAYNMTNALPALYHPSTVLFLDDDKQFLNNAILGLDENFLYQFCDDPHAVLSLLQKTQHPFLEDLVMNVVDVDDAMEHPVLGFNMSCLMNELLNLNRFQKISVLVVDYMMPVMDGLSLCKKLRGHPVKKLMITGKGDYSLAVKAFNDGIIDQFILKDDIGFYDALNLALKKLQMCYYQSVSQMMMKCFSELKDFPFSSDVLCGLFLEYVSAHNIQEYYLLDEVGSYLLVDNLGRLSIFVIQSESVRSDKLRIAKDNGASAGFLKTLDAQSKIIFLYGEKAYAAPVSRWREYTFKAEVIKDHGRVFYYCVIDEVEKFIDISKPICYWHERLAVL